MLVMSFETKRLDPVIIGVNTQLPPKQELVTANAFARELVLSGSGGNGGAGAAGSDGAVILMLAAA